MRLLIIIFCGVLGILPSNVQAKNSVSEDYKYYLIKPNSKDDILKSLNKASPIVEDNKIYHGYAYSHIDWDFKWRYNTHRCWISSVNIRLNTTYTLPKVKTQSNDVYDVWRQWYPKLVLHEKGHHNLAVTIAKKIESAIADMPHENTCTILEKKANAIGHAFISELGKLNRDYDRRTNHGETQGAFLSEYL